MNIFRVIVLRFLVWVLHKVGNGIKYIQGNKHIDISNVEMVLINRKDRIGDAIITKPLIELLYSYLYKYGYKGKLVVIASQYNRFVFDNMDSHIEIRTEPNTFTEYAIGIFGVIYNAMKTLIRSCYVYKNFSSRTYTTVFLDFVGNPNDILQYIDNQTFIASNNLFLNNFITHFSLPHSYVGGSSINLIQSYISLIEGTFGINNFSSYISERRDVFLGKLPTIQNKDHILLFVGGKSFRNVSLMVWENIIRELHCIFPTRTMVILDDNTNQMYTTMMKKADFPFKHLCQKNTFSLSEFQDFARDFSLRIGIDGGGFNMIRMLGSSITLYTLGNANVWAFFTAQTYQRKPLSSVYDAYSSELGGYRMGYVKKQHFLLPSFDYSLGESFFNDFPASAFAQYVYQFEGY